MARSKRHLEDSDEEVEEFTDSEQNNAAEDDSIDEEPPVEENTNGEAPTDSPTRSVSEFDREGTPTTPSLSGFVIEPIRMLARAAAGEESAVKPRKSSEKSGSKRTASTTVDDREDGSAPKTRKKKKSSSSSAAAAVTPTHAAARGDEEKMKSTGAIQRLWSDGDEIAILEGMYEFRAKTGSDPHSDSGAFFDFIKDSFHVEVSKNQLMDKIKRLKKKFRVNAEKSERGENPIFAEPHDSKAFKLSKKIWGKSEADEEIQIENNINEYGMKKKAKQNKSDKSATDVVPENGNEEPVTLGLPKQDVSRKKHKKKPNAESKPGCDEPAEGKLECEAAAGVESKWISEVEEDRNDEHVEKENDEEKIGGEDEFCALYPYLLDVVDIMVSQRVLGDIPKRLLVEKVREFGGEEAKKWDEKWKALQCEEMELHSRMLEFKAELSKAALVASKK